MAFDFMRRTRFYLLAPLIVLELALSGCGGDSGDSAKQEERPPATATAVKRAEIRITTRSITEEASRYTIDVKYPQTGLAVADDKIRQLVDPMVAEIKKSAQQDQFSAGKYMLAGSFETSLAGPDIVSIWFELYRYTGGAHGGNTIHGINFDIASGRELGLDDALAMTGLTLTTLADQARAQLKAKLGDMLLFPEGAEAKRENYSTFVISRDQVTFFFQEYQVAPYVAGSQQVSVPRKSSGP